MRSLARSVILILGLIALVWSFNDTARSDVIREGEYPSDDAIDVHVMDEASCPVCQPCIYYNFSD